MTGSEIGVTMMSSEDGAILVRIRVLQAIKPNLRSYSNSWVRASSANSVGSRATGDSGGAPSQSWPGTHIARGCSDVLPDPAPSAEVDLWTRVIDVSREAEKPEQAKKHLAGTRVFRHARLPPLQLTIKGYRQDLDSRT